MSNHDDSQGQQVLNPFAALFHTAILPSDVNPSAGLESSITQPSTVMNISSDSATNCVTYALRSSEQHASQDPKALRVSTSEGLPSKLPDLVEEGKYDVRKAKDKELRGLDGEGGGKKRKRSASGPQTQPEQDQHLNPDPPGKDRGENKATKISSRIAPAKLPIQKPKQPRIKSQLPKKNPRNCRQEFPDLGISMATTTPDSPDIGPRRPWKSPQNAADPIEIWVPGGHTVVKVGDEVRSYTCKGKWAGTVYKVRKGGRYCRAKVGNGGRRGFVDIQVLVKRRGWIDGEDDGDDDDSDDDNEEGEDEDDKEEKMVVKKGGRG